MKENHCTKLNGMKDLLHRLFRIGIDQFSIGCARLSEINIDISLNLHHWKRIKQQQRRRQVKCYLLEMFEQLSLSFSGITKQQNLCGCDLVRMASFIQADGHIRIRSVECLSEAEEKKTRLLCFH